MEVKLSFFINAGLNNSDFFQCNSIRITLPQILMHLYVCKRLKWSLQVHLCKILDFPAFAMFI